MSFWRSRYRRTAITKSFQLSTVKNRVLDEEEKNDCFNEAL